MQKITGVIAALCFIGCSDTIGHGPATVSLTPSAGPQVIGEKIRYISVPYDLVGTDSITYMFVSSWCSGSILEMRADTARFAYTLSGDTLTFASFVYIRKSSGTGLAGEWCLTKTVERQPFFSDSAYMVITDSTIENWGPKNVYTAHLDSTVQLIRAMLDTSKFVDVGRAGITDTVVGDTITLVVRDDLLLQWESSDSKNKPYVVHGIQRFEQPTACPDIDENLPDWLTEFISR